jgi:hypothetical protein
VVAKKVQTIKRIATKTVMRRRKKMTMMMVMERMWK